LPLSDFDAVGVEELVRFWSKRPVKPNGDRYSYSVCKNTIWLIRNFIKWLNKSKGFVWKKPADLDIDGIKILRDNKIKTKVDVYSINEIKVIWDFCTKFESQLILLALNCGFSIQEIGLLDWAEIENGYIKGIRPKSKVYGEFKLWDITKEVLGEPKKDGLVFLNKNGRGLYETTKGNNVSAAIPNAWNRLIKRIQKVHPGFRRLSFHKLRKTAGDFIRKKSDGETASVFLRHGHPVPEDKLLEIYTNPVFEKVFAAQDAVFEEFKGFLIPKKDDVIPRKLTPEQVVELKKEIKWGKKTSWLAKKYSVSATTIREYRKIATK
jgi:integrase